VAYVEEAKLYEIPTVTRSAYFEEVDYVEEARLNEIQ
jgi:hypothetical protein